MVKTAPHILLSTFNGAEFIAAQIESIQNQSLRNWILLIRDDGSHDDTVDILTSFAAHDSRIRLVNDLRGNVGIARNFGHLMKIALKEGAKVAFFADQDDVWLPEKLEIQLDLLKKIERKCGINTPLLIHSDLMVVDKQLNVLSGSFMKYQGISNESRASLNVLLVQNYVTGCTVAINRPLLELALPIPDLVMMHDWWLALCAVSCGEIGYIQTPTTLYRQHGNNEVGAKGFWQMLNPLRTNLLKRWKIGECHFLGTIKQASQLADRISKSLFQPHYGVESLINGYATCLSLGPFERLDWIRRNGLHRQGMIRQVLFLTRLLMTDHD